MRTLSVVRGGYYGHKRAVEPLSLYFTLPLREMGHEVETFDHFATSARLGRTRCTELLIETIGRGGFDLVLYQTSGAGEPVLTEALADLSRGTCIAAWNSDDDWRWETTSRLASHFTYMVTARPSVFEQNREAYSNLILSQWACLGAYSDFSRAKDVAFSFVGATYGMRNDSARKLRRKAGLVCFGRGSRLVNLGIPYFKGAFKLAWLSGSPLDFAQVNDIWNRTRVSYTPMGTGPGESILQIKGRTFEMGLSGTLMLCQQSPDIERYYEPYREFVPFDDADDCAEKARWYLAHEPERARIARNYHDRTLLEHMWHHRFAELFKRMGL